MQFGQCLLVDFDERRCFALLQAMLTPNPTRGTIMHLVVSAECATTLEGLESIETAAGVS